MMKKEKPKPAEMYEQYFVPAIFEPWSKVLLDYANPRKGERVLDLACGTGILARKLALQLGGNGKVIACDFSPEMLSVAMKMSLPTGINVEWREENATSLTFPNNSFDLLVCQQGVQFFPDKALAMKEMRRVLAPGGKLVFSVWQSLNKHPLYHAMFEAEALHLGVDLDMIATPFSYGDTDKIKQQLNDAGFNRIQLTRHTQEVKFPSPEKFVALTLLAGAAVIPEFSLDSDQEQEMFVQNISSRIEPVLNRFRDNDHIRFPMTSNIAVAYA